MVFPFNDAYLNAYGGLPALPQHAHSSIMMTQNSGTLTGFALMRFIVRSGNQSREISLSYSACEPIQNHVIPPSSIRPTARQSIPIRTE